MERCEYNDCGQVPVFATENVTGTEMKLCFSCFMGLFGKIIKDAVVAENY